MSVSRFSHNFTLLFPLLVCSHTLALSTNHVDLNLTMTGQAILIVTPGVGVFEVSHDPIFVSCDLMRLSRLIGRCMH